MKDHDYMYSLVFKKGRLVWNDLLCIYLADKNSHEKVVDKKGFWKPPHIKLKEERGQYHSYVVRWCITVAWA